MEIDINLVGVLMTFIIFDICGIISEIVRISECVLMILGVIFALYFIRKCRKDFFPFKSTFSLFYLCELKPIYQYIFVFNIIVPSSLYVLVITI